MEKCSDYTRERQKDKKRKKKEESCDYSRESFGSNRNNLFPAKFRSVLPFYQNKPFASPKWTISTSVQIRATWDNLSWIRHALVATNAWTAVKSTGCNCKLVSCFFPAIFCGFMFISNSSGNQGSNSVSVGGTRHITCNKYMQPCQQSVWYNLKPKLVRFLQILQIYVSCHYYIYLKINLLMC